MKYLNHKPPIPRHGTQRIRAGEARTSLPGLDTDFRRYERRVGGLGKSGVLVMGDCGEMGKSGLFGYERVWG